MSLSDELKHVFKGTHWSVKPEKYDITFQTERDSHCIKLCEIHCPNYYIYRRSGFPLKFLLMKLDLVSTFGLKAVGSLSCYLTRMEGNKHI